MTPISFIRDPRRLLIVLAHIILILIICILPEVLIRMAWPHRTPGIPWGVYAKSGVMVAVFYINYFVIIPRTLVRRHSWWMFALMNLALIAGATILMYYIGEWGWPRRSMRHRRTPDELHAMMASASFMLRDAIMLLLTVSLSLAIRLSARWREMERHRRDMIAARRESELEQLRAQLNPHFLFNTLNSIYALIDISPREARQAVHELSQMLRYMVYENPDRVELAREIDFVRHYMSLMRLRMGTRPVRFAAECDSDEATVPPLLFVTLVENAFKHGNTADRSLPIDISIRFKEGHITCRASNSYDASASEKDAGKGVGLANLRRRLELIYGPLARLDTEAAEGRFTATLSIDPPCSR